VHFTHIEAVNEGPKPFRWHKPADDALAKCAAML